VEHQLLYLTLHQIARRPRYRRDRKPVKKESTPEPIASGLLVPRNYVGGVEELRRDQAVGHTWPIEVFTPFRQTTGQHGLKFIRNHPIPGGSLHFKEL
jgi:hypothetical protein